MASCLLFRKVEKLYLISIKFTYFGLKQWIKASNTSFKCYSIIRNLVTVPKLSHSITIHIYWQFLLLSTFQNKHYLIISGSVICKRSLYFLNTEEVYDVHSKHKQKILPPNNVYSFRVAPWFYDDTTYKIPQTFLSFYGKVPTFFIEY